MPISHMRRKDKEVGGSGPRIGLPLPQAAPNDFDQDYVGQRISGMTAEYSGWDVYNNEARKVDMELVKDWTTSLNFLLLFAAIFATVLTAFTIESKKLLAEDPTSVMLDVMIFYTNSVANGTHTIYMQPKFEAPITAIIINGLLFASLSASLIAALASVVALQWVAEYDATITRGGSSPEDRAKRRQFRHAGVVWWKMSEIIAALPLLLYCSVVLFFAGLIQWIWVINQTVGLVVAGGAAITIIFYTVSTLIAVVSVSSPFRTPLSGWIYSLWVSCFMQIPAHPPWLRQRHSKYTAYHREEREVENTWDLGRQALVWLANQLSISQDSYPRLLLLVRELSSLPRQTKPCFDPAEASWYFIFDLLGWKFLTNDLVENLTPEGKEDMGIVERCYTMIMEDDDIVSPAVDQQYITDVDGPEYWSQHCNANRVHSWVVDINVPNHLFLLFRDLPGPSKSSPEEIEAVIRFTHWRNSHPKRWDAWREIFALAEAFSPEFLSSFVTTFSSFVRLQHWNYWSDEDREVCRSTIQQLTKTAEQCDEISSQATICLVQAYECLTVGLSTGQQPISCIPRPLRYGQTIRQSDEITHNLLVLLLSRKIHSYPPEEKIVRTVEVIVMLWLRPRNPVIKNWESLRGKYGLAYQVTQLGRQTVMDWIRDANLIPNITEIFGNLAKAQAQAMDIGPLWRASVPDVTNDPHFVEALQTFDCLMGPNCTPDDHRILIDLVCQDLALGDAPDFRQYFTSRRLEHLNRLKDPCLQALARCARGVDFIKPFLAPEGYVTQYRASLDRVAQFLSKQYSTTNFAIVRQLQASLWPTFSTQHKLYEEALREPTTLLHLQRVFQYPVTCPGCLEGPGHLLFHLLEARPPYRVRENLTLIKAVPLRDHRMPLALLVLCDGSARMTRGLGHILTRAEKSCLLELDATLDSIWSSEHHLLTWIWNVSQRFVHLPVYPEDLAAILVGIHKALQLPPVPESVPLIAPLASCILLLRERLMVRDFSYAKLKAVSDEAINGRQRLLGSLANRLIFGHGNARRISCARAGGSVRPAVDWLLPYDA